uniref:Trichohyalinlike protein putative n=1 Tax=Albugo laibachii Nc14 TaxID=890382 RepID=F0WWC0_9STRA|nr:trichohyalinlike protein putative [Albugo laibachii Nc14]|eukprot:CCA25740.1 trichohyalinlike protein putative [Albugo laibachii Nc14]
MQRQLCARIQRVLKKSPNVAERLALQILQDHAQQGTASEKSIMEVDDEKFCALVRSIASVPCRNARSCTSLPTDGEIRARTQQKSWSTDRPEPRDLEEKPHWDEDDVYISQAHLQQRSIGFTMTPTTRSRNRNSPNIWEDIVKYNSVMEQQERQDLKDRKMRNTSILSKELEHQVRQKQKESKVQEEENTRFHKQQLHFIEQQEVQEQKKALDRLLDIKELAKSQEMQLREKAVQKKKNLEHKKELEMRAVQRIQEEKRALEEREIAKRKAQKEQSVHVYQENQLTLSRKHSEKLKEKANDIKLAQEYIQMEERRDQQRKEHLESLSNSIKARMKMYDDTAKRDIEIKSKEEEQRLQQYQLQHAQQQAALEADEIQKRKLRNTAQKKILRLQVLEKKEREDRDRKDFDTQAIIWRQQQEEMELEEIAKKQKRKIDNKSQQDKLREQMLQKEKRQNWADQTLVEVQLNRPILEKIYHSSQIVQKIAQAVALETRDRSWQLRRHEAVTH